jgi:uncharacterized protein (TIGR00297 family)
MFLSQQDLYTGLLATGIIAFTVFVTETVIKKGILHREIARKLLHIVAICTCAWAIRQFENRLLLAFLFLFFGIFLWQVINMGWLRVNEQKTYGIALFPPAFASLLFLSFLPKEVIVFAVLVLGICDAAAGLAGKFSHARKIRFLAEGKSWTGFAFFYASCLVLSLIYFQCTTWQGWLFCAVLSLLPALTELFSFKGSDNFTVPVVTAIWTYLLLQTNIDTLQTLALLVPVFVLLCQLAIHRRWLTVGGAAAACWMGLLIYATCGMKGFIAPATFLIGGSLLSRLNKPVREKTGRNAVQVFANGIAGIICMVAFGITGNEIFLIAASVSFGIGMCDSVSSEAGVFFKGRTVNIVSLKKIEPGFSGGISVQGTLAGLAGVALLAVLVCIAYHFPIAVFLKITTAGFAGMVADSLLGSVLQARYQTSNGVVTEHATSGAVLVKGVRWCDNDVVNLISVWLVTGLFLVLQCWASC